MTGIDRCIHCGEYTPEGRFICYQCEYKSKHDNIDVKKTKGKTGAFTIYSQRLAGYLMMKGIPLIAIVKNSNTGYNNFLFPNTDKLNNAIDEWQNEI